MLWLLLLTTGTTASLRGLSAVDDMIAWASGTKGTVIRTSNGGKTFTSITVPDAAGLDFRDVQAFSADHAILMSAGPGPLSRIYITKDGGLHWKQTLTNKEEKGFYDSISFWNTKHGLLVNIPRQSRGPYFVSRSKRLNGVANAAPTVVGHLAGG